MTDTVPQVFSRNQEGFLVKLMLTTLKGTFFSRSVNMVRWAKGQYLGIWSGFGLFRDSSHLML